MFYSKRAEIPKKRAPEKCETRNTHKHLLFHHLNPLSLTALTVRSANTLSLADGRKRSLLKICIEKSQRNCGISNTDRFKSTNV